MDALAGKFSNWCVTFCADGSGCDGGKTVAGRVHAAENGNPHSLEKTGGEGEERSERRCFSTESGVIQWLVLMRLREVFKLQ